MVDFAMEVHKSLYPDKEVPTSLKERRVEILNNFKKLQAETEQAIKIFEKPEVTEQIKQSRDSKQLLEFLMTKYEFKPELVDTCYKFAKVQYECGNYQGASEYLYFHRILVQSTDVNYLNGMWGKLASEMLMQNWDSALEDFTRLRQFIDESVFGSNLQTLQQRTWLIHWSLFVFFNHPKGRDLIIDLFLYQPQYLNAIQTQCPHILSYLTTAAITNKKRRNVLKDLVKIIQQESYTYKDPITEFLECLYVNFDFDGAQLKLRECETVLNNDFFLVACIDEFIENARLFIFETFCRIRQCISINMLAEKLNMKAEESERWIVNLIRNARLDAKIDSKQGHVIMGTMAKSPYQQVIEKTKSLAYRSQMLISKIEKNLGSRTTQEANPWGGP